MTSTGNDSWAPTYDFASDEDPPRKINDAALQTQLQALAEYLSDHEAAVANVIGDDDTLRDHIVRIRHLHPELSAYFESHIEGSVVTNALVYYQTVRVATTANITLNDEQEIDGIDVVADDRILVKNQTDPIENGLYVVVAGDDWVRADDLPDDADAGSGWAVIVSEGDTNGETAWAILSGGDDTPIVGTDEIEFFAVFSEFPVTVAHGGTGGTTQEEAAISLGFMRRIEAEIIGDDSTTSFPLAHSLDTEYLVVSIRDSDTGEEVECDLIVTDTEVTVGFATAPVTDKTYNVAIIG